MINKSLSQTILTMAKLDQRARKKRDWKLITAVDRVNLKKMKAIVKTYGWPIISLVGRKASRMAWLLVQHADQDVKFQDECLGLMKKAAKDNQVSGTDIAYLIDKILVNKGLPQVYGTQFYRNPDGGLAPYPIASAKDLEQKRRAAGLTSFEKYRKSMDNVL